MGIVSSAGHDPASTLEALMRGRPLTAPSRHVETRLKTLPVGEVDMDNATMARLLGVESPVTHLRTALLGLWAARQAVDSASDSRGRTAFINGTTVGGMDNTERHFPVIYLDSTLAGDPRQMSYNDCGVVTRLIARHLDHKPHMLMTPSTACSSGANAIATGARLLQAGVVDTVVAGGAEALSRYHLNGFETLRILDRGTCRPFAADRAGINLGEGAAYLVMTTRRPSTRPLAVLEGWGNACDAYHQTATSAEAEGPVRAIRRALDMAGLTLDDISYINMHGTGTPLNDSSELTALSRLTTGTLPPYSSTKMYTGHTTSAAGAIEAVISILALNHDMMPGNAGTPGGDTQLVTRPVTGVRLNHVLSNSFGFGGNDTALVFSRQ